MRHSNLAVALLLLLLVTDTAVAAADDDDDRRERGRMRLMVPLRMSRGSSIHADISVSDIYLLLFSNCLVPL